MKRKRTGIFLSLAVISIMLLGAVSCGQDKEQAIQDQPAVFYQEASWARGYSSIGELCADQAIEVIAVGNIHRIIEVMEINDITYKTRFAFRIEKLLKGEETGEIVVNQMGTPDKPGFEFRDDPLFKVGEKYLFFLMKSEGGIYFLPGPWGRYQIIDNKVYSLNNTLADSKAYQAPAGLDFDGVLESDFIESIVRKIQADK